MFHYQKNIGDYRSATMHFSLLEHGVYNQLLDSYYLDEKPLTLDNRTLFRRLCARSEDEQSAVVNVLTEMFIETENGWVHKRVEREVAQYKAKADQAREAGKLGGRPSKKGIGYGDNRNGFNINRDGFEKEADAKPTANREPLTKNQEPVKVKTLVTASPLPDFINPEIWQLFKKHRGSKFSADAQTLTLKTLCKAHADGHDPNVMLEESVANGWKGVFPPKQNGSARPYQGKQAALEANADKVLADYLQKYCPSEKEVHESS